MTPDIKSDRPLGAVMLACASHAPLMYCYARAPDAHEAVEAAFAELKRKVDAFAPEVIFLFGPDHYTSLFQTLAPSFTIATRCEAVEDIGGHAGALDVPAEDAMACLRYLADHGVDAAVSHGMKVDHGLSQTLHRVAGAIDRRPTIPIIFNTMTPPLPPFHRSRRLGELVGGFARSLGKRVLFLGSGGLSHDPSVIYPEVGVGPPEITSWQTHGASSPLLSTRQWLDHLHDIHHMAAGALAGGAISPSQLGFNETFDREVMDLICQGRFTEMDGWDNAAVMKAAGVGAVEVHAWLAAASAAVAAGGGLPACDVYAQALEYGIAVGVIHSEPVVLDPAPKRESVAA